MALSRRNIGGLVLLAIAVVGVVVANFIAFRSPVDPPLRQVYYRYEDPRLTSDERRAVRVATEVVLDPKRPRPNLADSFRYEVKKRNDGWDVTVWSVSEFDDDNPQFAFGGHTWVRLDKNFKVVRIFRGR